MMLWMVSCLLVIFLMLGAVAFITLLERKILGLSQVRLGPNKTTFFGIFQPVMDGFKLLFKTFYMVMQSHLMLSLGPMLLMVFFMLVLVWIIPWQGEMMTSKYSSLLYFSMLGLATYAVILTGWSSMSSYSKLGSLRSMLQNLSFEIILMLIFMVILVLMNFFMLKTEMDMFLEMLITWVFFWILVSLMETNRAPFDLLEGESELISGFNIELSSLPFVYVFLSEYGMIVVMALIFSVALSGMVHFSMSYLLILVLLLRSCFPRIRYDAMMEVMWQVILPLSVMMFLCTSTFFS